MGLPRLSDGDTLPASPRLPPHLPLSCHWRAALLLAAEGAPWWPPGELGAALASTHPSSRGLSPLLHSQFLLPFLTLTLILLIQPWRASCSFSSYILAPSLSPCPFVPFASKVITCECAKSWLWTSQDIKPFSLARSQGQGQGLAFFTQFLFFGSCSGFCPSVT